MQVLFHTQIEKGPPTVERDEGYTSQVFVTSLTQFYLFDNFLG